MPQAIVPRRFNSDNTRSNFSKIFFSLESYIHSLSFDKASGKGQELHKLVLSDHSIAGSFTTNEGRTRLRLTADKIIKKTIWKSVGWFSKQQFASSTKGESDFLQRFVVDGFDNDMAVPSVRDGCASSHVQASRAQFRSDREQARCALAGLAHLA